MTTNPEAGMRLHPETSDLVDRFATALKEKLAAAEVKYGYSDGWRNDDWQGELVAKLVEHVQKGDPRDVAAFCAFAWHHGWSITPAAPVAPAGSDGARERVSEILAPLVRAATANSIFTVLEREDYLRRKTDEILASRAQPPVGEVVNAAHAAYGALWCMVTDNPVIHAARKALLEAIGGQRSQGQRDAIAWAGRHVQPPSDLEIMAIDAHPAEPAARDGGEA